MDYLKFIFYGLIQGLTEFLPVSSTAHLKILSEFIGLNDPGASFSAIIQLGSVFAIVWYFRRDIRDLFNLGSRNNFDFLLFKKFFKSVFLATIPIIFMGGFIKLFIPDFTNSIFRSNFSIAILSILMGLLMLIADNSKNKFINIRNHKYINSLSIGIAQSFAVIPGVSRSGITISIALLTGWDKMAAAKFSFLIGIPAISLVAFVELLNSMSDFLTFPFLPLLIGFFTTFFSSLLAINFLLKFLPFKGLKAFAYYRFFFGIIILLNA